MLYLETSGLVDALFCLDPETDPATSALRAESERCCSALTILETRRALFCKVLRRQAKEEAGRIARARLDAVQGSLRIFEIDEEILRVAAKRWPVEPTRSLDAIHLATIEALAEQAEIEVLASDRRIIENLAAMKIAARP